MKQLFSLLLLVAFFIVTSCSSENEGTDTSSASLSGNSSSSVESDSSSSAGPGDSSSSLSDDSSSSAGSGSNSSSSAGSSSSIDDGSSSSVRSSSSSARSSSSSRSSSSVGGGGSSSSTGTPTACTPSARSFKNVKYGPRSRNELDITLPSSGNGPWPVIMFVHGGVWQGNSTSKDGVNQTPFNNAPSKGYALSSIHYSVTNDGKSFPESVEDVLAAIRFLRAKAADYCFNPDKIGVTGFSSGGYFTHIAAVLSGAPNHGFDNASLGNAGVSSKVQAAASCSGLSDILKLNEHAGGGGMDHCSMNNSFFGFNPCTATGANKDIVDRSNPILHIKKSDYNCADAPPILSMHGKTDNIVPWQQSKLVVDELNAKCPDKGTYYEHSKGHECPSGYDNEIWQFLDAALK